MSEQQNSYDPMPDNEYTREWMDVMRGVLDGQRLMRDYGISLEIDLKTGEARNRRTNEIVQLRPLPKETDQ